MKKKDYEYPAMEVVEMKQKYRLLAGSDLDDLESTLNITYDEEDILAW